MRLELCDGAQILLLFNVQLFFDFWATRPVRNTVLYSAVNRKYTVLSNGDCTLHGSQRQEQSGVIWIVSFTLCSFKLSCSITLVRCLSISCSSTCSGTVSCPLQPLRQLLLQEGVLGLALGVSFRCSSRACLSSLPSTLLTLLSTPLLKAPPPLPLSKGT